MITDYTLLLKQIHMTDKNTTVNCKLYKGIVPVSYCFAYFWPVLGIQKQRYRKTDVHPAFKRHDPTWDIFYKIV